MHIDDACLFRSITAFSSRILYQHNPTSRVAACAAVYMLHRLSRHMVPNGSGRAMDSENRRRVPHETLRQSCNHLNIGHVDYSSSSQRVCLYAPQPCMKTQHPNPGGMVPLSLIYLMVCRVYSRRNYSRRNARMSSLNFSLTCFKLSL